VISLLLSPWPNAAREKDIDGWTPLHFACRSETSLDAVQLLLDQWLKAAENRNSYSVDSLADNNTPMAISNLLSRVSSLFNSNQNDATPHDIISFFININWWNGAFLVIDKYPTVT